MDVVSLSKADRFFPLISNSPESSGGSVSLQNILDLKDNAMLDALRTLQAEIGAIRSQSQLLDDALLQEPLLNGFFHFVDAAWEVAHARRVMDSGHALTVYRNDGSNCTLEGPNFYLAPIKASLQHIQDRYGRLELEHREGKSDGIRGGVERIVAMTKWLLMKNHFLDYLMTFEISQPSGSEEFVLKIPKWDGQRPIPDKERRTMLVEAEAFLIACCHPGRLGVFPAAKVQVYNG